MTALTFPVARETVIAQVRAHRPLPTIEHVELLDAAARVLASDIRADRDSPALARSARDGYAVRSVDLPGELDVIGEVRAGEEFSGTVGAGQAVEIMTGAPVPAGADAIVMVEHTRREGARVSSGRAAEPLQFINPQASEAAAGDILLHRGHRLDYSDLAVLAAVGCARVPVFRRPEVAIVPTGDELVEITATPLPFQVRNSNAYSLAAQVARAGGVPRVLPIARDSLEATRDALAPAFACDLVLLSGGVSAGKYDVVERVLASLGAEFYFDRVLIQPGQPVVFGRAHDKFFFGLPGNPASTMVTFEALARVALELLGGQEETALALSFATLAAGFHHRAGLTRFLPAHLDTEGEVTPIAWHGSGDIPAIARANVWLVADPARSDYPRGSLIGVLPK